MKNINLLHIEYLKFNNSRSLTLLLVFLLINGIAQYLTFGLSAGATQLTEADKLTEVSNTYATYFRSVSFIPSIFVVFLVVINMGSEFMQGTLRRNIIDGCSRYEFFLGKLYAMLLIAGLVLLLSVLEIVLVGFRFGHSLGDLLSALRWSELVRWQLLFSAYAMIGFLIACLVRNSATGIVLFLGSMVAEKLFSVIGTFSSKIDIEPYLPYFVIDQMVSVSSLSWGQVLLIALYMLLMLGASLMLLLKRDL